MKADKTMKIARTLFLFVALSAQFPTVATAEDAAVANLDKSKWKCTLCESDAGWSGEVELGPGYISSDFFKFGEYTGLNDEGFYTVANGMARYRDKNAYYVDMRARNLGLDSRSLSIEAGRQGSYDLFLRYDEIPHLISDTAATPYNGSGSESISLPPGWVNAGSTAGMTSLATSLRGVDLATKRKRLGVGASYIQDSRWKYAVEYRRDNKEGKQRTAGAFFFDASQLVEPIDYITDEVDVSASYSGKQFQAKLTYYGSSFRNNDNSLTWENPYTPLVPGATAGQLANAPDNQFHQVLFSAGYEPNQWSRISGDIALGRMLQDENFRLPTLNASLGAPAAPRRSLDGEVDTLTVNLRGVAAPTNKLRLNGTYTYNDRDNQSSRSTYTWVSGDSFVAAPRTNQPYSFTKNTLKLSADYRHTRAAKFSAGFDYEKHERTLQEIDETKEGTGWLKTNIRISENVDLMIKLAHGERDASGQQPAPGVDPPENPLMRKYNFADRDRDTAKLRAYVMPLDRISIGVEFDYADDDYSNSELGLTEGREISISADASMMVGEKTSLYVFGSFERIESKQRGSQTFSTADWSGKNEDTITTGGFGVKHQLIEDKLDIGLDLTISSSKGEITVKDGTGGSSFPDLEADRASVKLYGTYHLKDTWSLRTAYWFEHYDEDDWALDGVTPGTIPNVISFGEESPSDNVSVITFAVQYKF
ncbi:MAG: MtrB/PioB family decaheme-associated outer membrane protein [Gammaproteobacteria bacterium]